MPSRASLQPFSTKLGLLLILSGLVLFLFIFYPVISEEVKYALGSDSSASNDQLVPVDTDFSIVIPKIRANAKVIPNVDPNNAQEYQRKLTQGVAHASTSSFPNEAGNMFLFAHSSDNFYNANRYNSVFYLLTKMEKDEEIKVYYSDIEYTYKITSKRTVSPENVQYLYPGKSDKQTITLMTCWPPGTTLNRLLVQGELVESAEIPDKSE